MGFLCFLGTLLFSKSSVVWFWEVSETKNASKTHGLTPKHVHSKDPLKAKRKKKEEGPMGHHQEAAQPVEAVVAFWSFCFFCCFLNKKYI